MHSMSLLRMLKRSLELYPTHPLWSAMPSFNQLVFLIRETCRLGKDTTIYPSAQIIPGMVDRRLIRTLKASQGVWHKQLSNSSLSYCRYAGIVFLEEKIASNSLINWQDMWMKRWPVSGPRITMQIIQTLYKAQGGLLFLSMSITCVTNLFRCLIS